jgi:O-antigen/teichoic acid export membrane protein
MPFYLNYLGAGGYAIWGYTLAFTGSLGFADAGLGVATGRFVGIELGRGDQDRARRFWATGHYLVLAVSAGVSCLYALAAWFLGPLWFSVAPAQVALAKQAFLVSALGLFIAYYRTVWLLLAQAHMDFAFAGIVRTSIAVFSTAASIWLVWWSRNPVHLILLFTAAGAVEWVCYAVRAARTYGFRTSFADVDRSCLGEMWPYAAKTVGNLLLGSPLANLDRLLIGRWAPVSFFAAYTVAANLGSRLLSMASVIMTPVFNRATRYVGQEDYEGLGRLYAENVRLAIRLSVFALVWTTVWRAPLLMLWLGPDMAGLVAVVLPWVMFAVCVKASISVAAAKIAAMNRMGTQLVITCGIALATLVGLATGFRLGGAVGMVIGFAVSQVSWIVLDLFAGTLTKQEGWASPATWRGIGQEILVGACGWLVATAVRDLPMSIQCACAVTYGAVWGGWSFARHFVKSPTTT